MILNIRQWIQSKMLVSVFTQHTKNGNMVWDVCGGTYTYQNPDFTLKLDAINYEMWMAIDGRNHNLHNCQKLVNAVHKQSIRGLDKVRKLIRKEIRMNKFL